MKKEPNCQDNTCGHIDKMFDDNPDMKFVHPNDEISIPRAGETIKYDPDVLALVDAKFSLIGEMLIMWVPNAAYKIGDKYDLMRLRDMADAAIRKISEKI